jgi:hypothetical protein
MTAHRPEADTEYSKAGGPSRGPGGQSSGPGAHVSRTVALGILVGGLLGSLLLIVAEFTEMAQVHTAAHNAPIATVSTGSHNDYAMIPLGILAALFTVLVWRLAQPGQAPRLPVYRLMMLAVGLLGLVALLIAVLNDLPDAHGTGLVGSASTHYTLASVSPSVGLYLETLGAVSLLLAGGAGLLLLTGPGRPSPRDRDQGRSARVPASEGGG